jgi:hypothetical protein
LVAAEKWGCPPWAIRGDDSAFDRLLWFWRWQRFEALRVKANEVSN